MGNQSDEHRQGENQDSGKPTYYIGIGASAGGLEAIETFFTHMPPNSGFAFVVVQHLSPDYKSLMVELLSKKTSMPVLRAENGMIVEANKVYLIPPKNNLTIFHGKLLLDQQDHTRGLNLPIDIFFRSLAEDQNEKAVGIILSGTGSDGMRGTRAIKENGGMIMVQDEESAKFDGMPRSAISTGLTDFILPPEDMPKQLLAFSTHPFTAKADRAEALLSDEDGLTRIFALLREKSKVDFTYYKPTTVTRRIERRMSVNQFDNIQDYVAYLQEYPGEIMALYRELLIGVTRFFRDQEAFSLLGDKWLPELLEKSGNREIRFWVAGCSTGEEAYTFAIIARECMERIDKYFDIKIFATDVDKDAILKAGTGIFPASIAADLSPRYLAKYFYNRDDNFQIARNIREMVVFAQHNLIKDPPFTNINLVSCRNLLIYLQPVLQKKALELINFSLNASGLLVLGTSETVGDMATHFKPLSQKHKIFKSTGKMKASLSGQDMLSMAGHGKRDHLMGYQSRGGRFRNFDSDKSLERLIESISDDYIPLTLIVNDQLEVQHVFGNTEGFLKVPSGRISNDISKMASRDLSIPLTTGIQKVFREEKELTFTNIVLQYMDQTNSVNLRIKPLIRQKGQESLVAVFLSNVQHDADRDEDTVRSYDLNQEAAQRIKDLEQELQFTKENLQATIEELETANEELQATNEELLASNEELQSTNEELQSTNEELYTVNTEYQNKIIELTELNNDVENLFASTQVGTLLLDENLEIRKFSRNVTEIMNILDGDAGRPVKHINHHIINYDPHKLIKSVHETYRPLEEQILLKDGRWFLMRIVPYAIGPQRYSGVVVSFVEISQIKEAEKALAESEANLKQTAKLAKVGSWEYVVDTGTQKWSEQTYRIHELEPGRQPTPEEGIKYYTEESIPVISHAFKAACEIGRPYDLVLEIITAKGNRKWVRAIASPEKENGKVVRIRGAFQDITEIQRIDLALEESEKQYRYLFNSMEEGFAYHEIITDEDGMPVDYRFLAANPAFEKLTGLKVDDIVGRTVLEILPETESYWIQRYGKVAQTGEPDYFENYSHELDRWYSVASHSPKANHFSVLFTDITWKRKQEEELKKSEELFRTLFETMAQGVVYQDADGRITRANSAAERILGLSIDQMQGRTSMDPRWRAIHEDGSEFPGDTHPAMIALRIGQKVENVMMGVYHPESDQIRWININAVPRFRDGEDKPYQVYATFEDITERYIAERELENTKNRLDLAFEAAGMGWWDWDLKTQKVSGSPEILDQLGYGVDELGTDANEWFDLVHEADHEKTTTALNEHLEGRKERYEVKYRLRTKEGAYQLVRDRGKVVERDEMGRATRLIGTISVVEPE